LTLNAGFHIDQTMSSESGNLTALYWSLVQGKKIEDRVVEFLISRGGEFDIPSYYPLGDKTADPPVSYRYPC
jgi:hypothetical protein